MCDCYFAEHRDDNRKRGKKRQSSSTDEPASYEKFPAETGSSNNPGKARRFQIHGRYRLRLLQSLLCLSFFKDDCSLDGSPYFDSTFKTQSRTVPRTVSYSSLDSHSEHTLDCYDDPNLVPPDSRFPIICPIGSGRSLFANSSPLRKLSPSAIFHRRSSQQM